MSGLPAIGFSGLAALFYAFGYMLLPTGLPASALVGQLAALPAIAFVGILLSTQLPGLAAAGRLLCGLWPCLVFPLICRLQGQGVPYLLSFGLWPFLVASIAAGLALMPVSGRQLPTLALFPFGAVLATCLTVLALIIDPSLGRLLAASPYHFVITHVLASTLVALADAASASLPPSRERLIRSLAAMMPLLGFLGTIAGLILALGGLPALFSDTGQTEDALARVIDGLSTAFETTLVGLVGAALCNFFLLLLVDRQSTRT